MAKKSTRGVPEISVDCIGALHEPDEDGNPSRDPTDIELQILDPDGARSVRISIGAARALSRDIAVTLSKHRAD